MQIVDETLPNVYACGDVADTGTRNPNSRAAMQQAMIAADNVVLAARGKQPRYNYKRHWAESVIKLTLGLVGRLLTETIGISVCYSFCLLVLVGKIYHALRKWEY
jgi:NADH dehydrogenase FAD-containing subunit